MSRLRIAVIGCGHLGRIHARLLQQNHHVQLVAVADPVKAARDSVSNDLRVKAVADYRELIPDMDAAIVAAPTGLHFEIAANLLNEGIDLLVEKPVTDHAQSASELSRIARQLGRVLAVGHVERFNPALRSALRELPPPSYIETARCSSFTFRSMDVGVVLDLMIHDLDIVLSIANSPVSAVTAWGQSVVTAHEDVAVATLQFASGCTASLKASRVSQHARREMTLFGDGQHVRVDFAARTANVMRLGDVLANGPLRHDSLPPQQTTRLQERVFKDLLPTTALKVPECNPLADEQQDFVDSIRTQRPPMVCGSEAADAVAVACRILDQVSRHRQPRLHRPAA